MDRYEDGGVALDAEGKVAPKVTGASTGDSQEPLHLLDSIALFTSTEMLAEKVVRHLGVHEWRRYFSSKFLSFSFSFYASSLEVRQMQC